MADRLTRSDTAEGWMGEITARMADTTRTVDLDDGRTVAYCAVGDEAGVPVFVFHGGIGSRGFGLLFDADGRQLGIRIIAPDRPGYGRSDPAPDRTLLEWAADVERLADALSYDRFAVLGVSGGGPYAAACAAALPRRITAAALVSSLGPPGAPKPIGLRILLTIARTVPWLLRLPVGRQLRGARQDPAAAVARRARGKAEPEAAMHRGPAGRILTASTAEAGRQGVAAAVAEMGIVARPWEFDLTDIDVPVGLWYGALDRTIPTETGHFFADAIPDSQLTIHDDVGHLSLPVTYASEILTYLLESL